jgi:hypothetical protein
MLYVVRLTVIHFIYITFPKLVCILIQINFQDSFVFFRLFSVLLLEQLADMLQVFMVLPVLLSAPPNVHSTTVNTSKCSQYYQYYCQHLQMFTVLLSTPPNVHGTTSTIVNTSKISTCCSNLLCTIWPAIQILHRRISISCSTCNSPMY